MSRSRSAVMPLNANAPGLEPEPVAGPHIGLQSETIVLETRDFDLDTADPPPGTVKERFALKNRLRATTTELAIFHEYYAMIRVKRKGRKLSSVLINLRYLDSRPVLSRFVATKLLRTALGLLSGALLAGLMACISVLTILSTLTAISLVTAAGVALWLFADRTNETITFRTAEGLTPALVLRANFGCRRACRALVPSLVQDIVAAKLAVSSDRHTYLRRAIREHYRLLEMGVISADVCSAGTRRILAKFDSEQGARP